MKQMKTPRGTARAKRRQFFPMLPPSPAAQAQQARDDRRLGLKLAAA